MANVFIDCGANIGQGLMSFASMYRMDSSWIVETFEPNPSLINTLKANVNFLPMQITIHNKAVWNYDGEVECSIMLENSEGSSINKLLDAGICSDPTSESYRKHDSIISVPCVDISSVIKKYQKSDNIIVKLDVEGSEFCIVRKLLEDNTIEFINDLYVEWHTPYMSTESIQTQNNLIHQIFEKGVRHHTWH